VFVKVLYITKIIFFFSNPPNDCCARNITRKYQERWELQSSHLLHCGSLKSRIKEAGLDRAYATYGGEQKCVQCFGEEARKKSPIHKTLV